MPKPFDWEEDREPDLYRRRFRGDGSFVTHWELADLEDDMKKANRQLADWIERVEDKLVVDQAKRLVVDLATSGMARVGAIILGVIVALILANIIHVPIPFD